jgi:uncharacterized membrane protein
MPRGDPNRNLVAALSYLLGFVTGIVILLVEKDDKYIRFHAMQSTLLFAGFFVLNLVVDFIIRPVDFLGFLSSAINSLITIVLIIVWVVSMYKAYSGEVFKWPVVGNLAEKNVR